MELLTLLTFSIFRHSSYLATILALSPDFDAMSDSFLIQKRRIWKPRKSGIVKEIEERKYLMSKKKILLPTWNSQEETKLWKISWFSERVAPKYTNKLSVMNEKKNFTYSKYICGYMNTDIQFRN